jgi:beta-galactosidase
MHTPPGVEVTVRRKGEQALLFMLNHNAEAATLHLGGHTYRDLLSGDVLQGQIEIAGYGVRILTTHA